MFAEIAFLLYVGHLLADYPFQTDHQADCKAKAGREGWAANLTHAGTHVVTCGLMLTVGSLLLDWHLPLLPAAAAVLWIGATHSIIDRRWPIARWMIFARQPKWAQRGGAAHVDQTAHITALAAAALYLAA
ncbi:DUF3307 domain-containing protein [Streptomyces lydicus]|uniref:DUF3307 domain-containing protein n=1 Tax=Streptomyces lydicus TaxID=47763 RepID=UPI0036E08343